MGQRGRGTARRAAAAGVTLPTSTPPIAECPRVPTTMTSASTSAAISAIPCAGCGPTKSTALRIAFRPCWERSPSSSRTFAGKSAPPWPRVNNRAALRISASRLVHDVHHDQQRLLPGRQRLRIRERSDSVRGPIRRPDNRVEHRTSLGRSNRSPKSAAAPPVRQRLHATDALSSCYEHRASVGADRQHSQAT